MPGCLMAMGRLNRPSLMVYGGTIRAGHGEQGEKLDVDLARSRATAQFIAGAITETQRREIVRQSLSRRRRLRRHVHRQHDGVGRSRRSA